MTPAQASAVNVATTRSIGRPATPIHSPAAARNLTSPRPRPWIFLKAKYSRLSSQNTTPIAAPSHAASRPANTPPATTAFDSPSSDGRVQPVRNDSVANIDPCKYAAQQTEQRKESDVDSHAGAHLRAGNVS